MDGLDLAYLGLVLTAFAGFLGLVAYAMSVTGRDFPRRSAN